MAALIVEANRRIWERSLNDPETAGMGTTVTAALVDHASGTVAIGHVGDSRAYLLRAGALEQLTTDHSLVAELVESGVLTPEEAERHPQRSAITRALGTEPTVEVDAFTVEADSEISSSSARTASRRCFRTSAWRQRSSPPSDPDRAADALVAAANAEGGEDNITVVLFEMVEGDAPEALRPRDEETAVGLDGDQSGGDGHKEDAAFAPVEPTRHGAGSGRIAALALVVALLALCLVVLYVAVR